MRNIRRVLGGLTILSAVLAVSACGGGGGGSVQTPPAPQATGPSASPSTSNDVPSICGTSGSAFVAFIQSLVTDDETSEPKTIASDFSVPPADETNEPVSLG